MVHQDKETFILRQTDFSCVHVRKRQKVFNAHFDCRIENVQRAGALELMFEERQRDALSCLLIFVISLIII